MRQNAEIFDGGDVEEQVVIAALRFYAKHEYLHDDQKRFVIGLANRLAIELKYKETI